MPGLPSLLLCVGAAACGLFTGPSESPLRAETVAQQDPQGCRKVQFTIVGDTAVTGVYPDTACGMQLELVAAGAMGWSGDTLSIPFRLRNRSGSSVLLPVRLEVRDSGIVALEPEEAPTGDVVALNMDSTLSGGRRVWLVGGSGALAAGDSTGVATLLFRVDAPVTEAAFAFELVGHEGFVVAMMPPDFTPAWFSHDSSHISGTTLKRALAVRFHSAATLQDRLTAIAAVNGAVIGGMYTGAIQEETYFIGIPGAIAYADLRAARDSLLQYSSVRYAVVMSRVGAHGRRPSDGSGLTPNEWLFSPDQSAGWNWAAEELALPLAWGCETGSAQVKVGVLDLAFSGGDYSANVFSGLPSTVSLNEPHHGNRVASILAAVGNNNTGMAGAVWTTNLALRAIGDHSHDIRVEKGLASLIADGVRVISLNLGTLYDEDEDQMADQAEPWAHAIGIALQDVPANDRPLVVVSAGNDNQNARLSGPPMLKEFGPQWDSIMVVVAASGQRTDTTRGRWGGSSFTRGFMDGSNHGALIDVYAPGQGVYVRTSGTGTPSQVTGTSFAAPHVAGIAALLFSFDPSLTAAEVKELILQGAVNGGRAIENDDTRYLANAYESLKLAARKSNGALCGNRIWATGTEIHVERDSAVTEVLLDTGAPAAIQSITTHHGGRTVGYRYSSGGVQHRAAVYNGSAWSPSGQAPSSPAAGAVVSSWGMSHDGDAWAYSVGGNQYTHLLIFFGGIGVDDDEVASFAVPAVPGSYDVCLWHDGTACQTTLDIVAHAAGSMGWDPHAPIAVQPMGDTLLVAMSYVRIQNPSSAPVSCPSWLPPPNTCAVARVERRVDSSTVYALPSSGGAPTRLWSQTEWIAQIGIADDLSGRVVTMVHDSAYISITYGLGGGDLQLGQPSACKVEFRSGYGATPAYSIPVGCHGMMGGITPVTAEALAAPRSRTAASRPAPP